MTRVQSRRHSLALATLALCLGTQAQAAVFINELHYDNLSADVGEFVEVVATAGEDLTQYSIVRYNGSVPSAAVVYGTDTLPAGSTASCAGGSSAKFAVLNYPQDGLQNGTADGLALVLNGTTVIQFLSYEGIATAAAGQGPAAGMVSTDIGVSEAATAPVGTSLQLGGGPGTLYSDFTWNGTATATSGGCNNGQSFGPTVDNPPTVTSTTPAGAATNVPVTTNIVVNFSEPVTTTDPWINLTCSSLNLSAGTITSSNGGATWTLDPTDNPDPNSNCTVTITGASVRDTDGTLDPMAANYQWSFQTAPDNVPTVQNTFPANNAVNVPIGTTLTVTFSEAVTAPQGAFTLTCATVMGTVPFTFSNAGQVTYQINPDANLPVTDDCTLTIDGAQIIDLDGSPDAVGGEIRVNFETGAGVSDYYATVDTSSCRALRSTLHGVIDDHTALAYGDVYPLLNEADEDPSNPNNVLDIYRNESYVKHDSGAVGYNREHVWPNSHGFNDLLTLDGFPNPPYTDVHMLMASNTDYNSRRGNSAFGTCSGCSVDPTIFNAGNGVGGDPGTTADDNFYNGGQAGAGSYQVWNYRRGDLARAMLYMDVRFEGGRNSKNFQREPDLILTDNTSLIVNTGNGAFVPTGYSGRLSTLLAWHNEDNQISTQEVLRNDVVANVQGNRNPFVDHPEWAAIAFASPCLGPDLVAVDDTFAATEDTTLNRNGANDIGVLNDDKVYAGSTSLTASLVNGTVSHGSATVQSNGQFSYVPPANFCGKATFQYTATNGTVSDTAIANIEVACVNDLPTAVGTLPNQSYGVGVVVSIPTASGFTDVDGDDLVYSMTGAPASLTINPTTGEITGTTASGDIGVSNVSVRATESGIPANFATQSFTITVTGTSVSIFANGFE